MSIITPLLSIILTQSCWASENQLLSLDYDTGDSDTGLYEYACDHRIRRVVRDESAVSGRDRSLIVFAGIDNGDTN